MKILKSHTFEKTVELGGLVTFLTKKDKAPWMKRAEIPIEPGHKCNTIMAVQLDKSEAKAIGMKSAIGGILAVK